MFFICRCVHLTGAPRGPYWGLLLLYTAHIIQELLLKCFMLYYRSYYSNVLCFMILQELLLQAVLLCFLLWYPMICVSSCWSTKRAPGALYWGCYYYCYYYDYYCYYSYYYYCYNHMRSIRKLTFHLRSNRICESLATHMHNMRYHRHIGSNI